MKTEIELSNIKVIPKDIKSKKNKHIILFFVFVILLFISIATTILYAKFSVTDDISTPASTISENNTESSITDNSLIQEPPRYRMVENTMPVEHIFFHPLIAYPELAFDGDYMEQGFDDWFVTAYEFQKILQSLYDNDYILVNLNDIFEYNEENKKYMQKSLMLPEGKKPLVLSIDDMNYYEYMIENGTVHKLVLDNNNEVAAYTVSLEGEPQIRRDLAIVPILDDFVKNHPDFSYNGAKGCIALTGYEGVLGYRTYEKENDIRQAEIDSAMPVIEKLLETGWYFASHGYGHYDAALISYNKLESDTIKWKNEVETLIGETQLYIYPFGSGVKYSDPKFKMLSDLGFKAMCVVGNGDPYYSYNDLGVITQRWHIDGITLKKQPDLTMRFYNASEIIDPVRP